jgi:hypothetical protein
MIPTQEQRDGFIKEYIESLPPEMRPDSITRTIDIFLANSFHYGWNPKQLAHAVAAGVRNTDNPVGAAVKRLHGLSLHRPPKTNTTPKFVPEPKAPKLPDELRQERAQVMKDLMRKKITEDEAVKMIQDIYDRFAQTDSL